MDIYSLLKLVGVVTALLLVSYFILNTVLLFIVRFSDQLRQASKNALIAVGVIYMVALVFDADQVLDVSQPLIDVINSVFPGFLNKT